MLLGPGQQLLLRLQRSDHFQFIAKQGLLQEMTKVFDRAQQPDAFLDFQRAGTAAGLDRQRMWPFAGEDAGQV